MEEFIPTFDQITRIAPVAGICIVLIGVGWWSRHGHLRDLRDIIDWLKGRHDDR